MLKSSRVLLILAVFFTTYQASAITLDKLGQRLSSCQNLQYDDFIVELDESLKREARNLFEDNKLTAVVITQPDCFRVGTEIKLFLENDGIPYLGKALIKKIEILSSSELLSSKNSPYSKTALKDFVKDNSASQYGLMQIAVSEKVEEQVITDKYTRLPTCFPSYSDWEAMRLQSTDSGLVKDIQSGRNKAQIWNGTFNCYKIGIFTKIQLPGDYTDYGSIVPTELHLIHFSNLNSQHARLMGMNLTQLKKTLEDEKDVDGGYVTMVVYDYAEPLPPEPENNNSEDQEEEEV